MAEKWLKTKRAAAAAACHKLVHVHFHCYCYGFSFVLLCDCHALARYIYGPLNGFATFPRHAACGGDDGDGVGGFLKYISKINL